MSLNLALRKYFSIGLNLAGLAPRFWEDSSSYFITVDYHYLSGHEVTFPTLEVSRDILDKQLNFMHRNMNVINPKYFDKKFFLTNQSKKSSILVTIDDGDSSIQENFDLFQKYQIPIIFFIPFGLCLEINSRDGLMSRILRSFFEIEENKLSNFQVKEDFFKKVECASMEELKLIYSELLPLRNNIDPISNRALLSIDVLKEMAKDPLITLGSHSMSHPVLSGIPEKWLDWELTTSVKYLQMVQGDNKYFAYPYGFKDSINNNVKNKLKELGVEYAFSTRSMAATSNSDSLELGRIGMLNFFNRRYLYGLAGRAFEVFDKILLR